MAVKYIMVPVPDTATDEDRSMLLEFASGMAARVASARESGELITGIDSGDGEHLRDLMRKYAGEGDHLMVATYCMGLWLKGIPFTNEKAKRRKK